MQVPAGQQHLRLRQRLSPTSLQTVGREHQLQTFTKACKVVFGPKLVDIPWVVVAHGPLLDPSACE